MSSLAAADEIDAFEGDDNDVLAGGPDRLEGGRVIFRLPDLLRRELTDAWREPLLRNGHFLTLSSAATALVGLIYWSLAAHLYSTTVVGDSAAVISAMMLMGGMAQLGLMSALVRFVPVAGTRTKRLVVASYLTAGVVAAALGAVFVAVAPTLSGQFRFVTADSWSAVGLVLCSALWAVFVLQDSVLTGIRQAFLVAVENAFFSVLKVIAVVVLAAVLLRDGILVSWWVALAVAVVGTNAYLFSRAIPWHSRARGPGNGPEMAAVSFRAVAGYAGPDHAGGLWWLAVTTATPLIVLASVGATKTAYFTVAWQFGVALFALSANMGASLMVETADDQTDLPSRWRRVVKHSLLPLAAAIVVLEVGAPLILRVFGLAYAQHATALLRLMALAALPNLVTETAVFALRSQRRTAAAAAVLTSVSAGILVLAVLLLPHLGIVAVGFACVIAETAVAAALLCRSHWWLPNRAPRQPGADSDGGVRATTGGGAGTVLLGLTVGLIVVGSVMLVVGLSRHATSIVLASLFFNGLALLPLAMFYRAGRPTAPVAGDKNAPDVRLPAPASCLPIEDYDRLRVNEILPLLQELDRDRLSTVREYEASALARANVLRRIDDLVSSWEEPDTLGTSPEIFPIAGYDQLRVVDILPLLTALAPEALRAVAAREEAGARRRTVLSRVERLCRRAEGATPIAASGSTQAPR